MDRKYLGLDVLRLIAALCVIQTHYNWFAGGYRAYEKPYPGPASLHEVGKALVTVFWMLSGFVFDYLYTRPVTDGSETTRSFIVKRASRLLPLYYLTHVWAVLVIYFWDTKFSAPAMAAWSKEDLICNTFLFQSWATGYCWPGNYNGPAWSVSLEVLVYFLFFVACRAQLAQWTLFVIATCAASFGYMYSIPEHSYPTIHPTCCFTAFTLGMLLYRGLSIVRDKAPRWGCNVAAASLAAVAVAVYTEFSVYKPRGIFEHFCFAIPLVAAAALTDFSALAQSVQSAMEWCGNLSYAIYMIHAPIFMSLSMATAPKFFGERFPIVGSLWGLALVPACIFIAAIPVYALFEMPVQKAMRKLLLAPGDSAETEAHADGTGYGATAKNQERKSEPKATSATCSGETCSEVDEQEKRAEDQLHWVV